MWKQRTEQLIGREQSEKLRQSHILIAGLGGVGAHAAEHLCRCGAGALTVIDSDHISESNLNRQLLALHSTIGLKKTEILKTRLQDINPEISVNTSDLFISAETDFKRLFRDVDYVIDCIDTLTPKIELINAALKFRIPLVSSMGSGARLDPLKVKISDISDTNTCTLARILRKRLHRRNIYTGFDAVFSEELPVRESVEPFEGKNQKSIAGTISYMPAIFGTLCAYACIRKIMQTDKN